MLYNGGWVETSLLDRLKLEHGRIYRSCIPDVYSAVAIARAIDSYVFVREPLAINGASRHSTGAAQFGRKQPGGAAPDEVFRSEGNLPFHSAVPLADDGSYPLSLQVIVYESYLQSAPGGEEPGPAMHATQLEVILASVMSQKYADIDDLSCRGSIRLWQSTRKAARAWHCKLPRSARSWRSVPQRSRMSRGGSHVE
jgi:hypothetical protein